MYLEKQGKVVYAVDDGQRAPTRELTAADIQPLLVNVGPFGPAGKFFGYHENTFILYLLLDSDDRPAIVDDVKAGKVAIYPRRRAVGGPGTLDMFWRSRNVKSITKLLVGAVQYAVLDDKVVITHMSVLPKWRRNRLNTLMIEAIAQDHPGMPFEYDAPTDMGEKFMTSRGLGDAVLEMFNAGVPRHEIHARLRDEGLSGAAAGAVLGFGELICF